MKSATAGNRFNGASFVNPTQVEIDASNNSIAYANVVNVLALCDHTDWRLSTKEELAGIVVAGQSPAIDNAWLPNTQANVYWTSSPFAGGSNGAWNVYFVNGDVFNLNRAYNVSAVRLVRASQ